MVVRFHMLGGWLFLPLTCSFDHGVMADEMTALRMQSQKWLWIVILKSSGKHGLVSEVARRALP